VGVDGKRADDEHPAWYHPQHCFVTDEGVRVHQQVLTCGEDDTAKQLRFESRLLDPTDDEQVYLDLNLECLRISTATAVIRHGRSDMP
jgi:hypothetical protein